MIKKLKLKNFALIKEAEINFDGRLCAITGETGAGKSTIAEALEFLFAAKAYKEIVREGENYCEVTAEFDPSFCAEIENVGKIFSLKRTADKDLKSKFFINEKPSCASFLKNIKNSFADFYGQQQSAFISSQETQLEIIDAFAQISQEKKEYAEIYNERTEIISKLKSLSLSEEEKNKLYEMYSFQLEEIEKLNIDPVKDSTIEEKILRFKQKDKLNSAAGKALDFLKNSDNCAQNSVFSALNGLSSLEGKYPEIDEICLKLRNISQEISDISENISSLTQDDDLSQKEIDALIERDEKIKKLKKKYGEDLNDIIKKAEELRNNLKNLSETEYNASQLEKKLEAVEKKLSQKALKLSERRKLYALKLQTAVLKELKDLGLEKASFFAEIDFNLEYAGPNGCDKAEFLFSANPGSPAKPLRYCASGGELSRLSLALKSSFSGLRNYCFSFFDEIDAGVGGNTAFLIGEKLKKISSKNMVLFITHLPQTAAFADFHIKAEKKVKSFHTEIVFRSLSLQERKEELARMLGSKYSPQTAIKHAEELLKNA
ncbi:MAG: DNA repair protein RecN [Elusimicrobia bacterium]|nr:DNA repair protein RecN [Elusimicrobiota bacterium]